MRSYLFILSEFEGTLTDDVIATGPGCILLLMCSVWAAMTVWDGTTTRRPTAPRNIRKVSNPFGIARFEQALIEIIGKYLLEREKLVKENNWILNE